MRRAESSRGGACGPTPVMRQSEGVWEGQSVTEREDTSTIQFKLRMRERLRSQLEESSAFHDRSINSEIVDRLEQSFAEQFQAAKAIGGEKNATLVRAIHDALRSVTSQSEGCEADDNSTQQQMCAALIGVAQAISGLRAENLLQKVAADDTWRSAAARA